MNYRITSLPDHAVKDLLKLEKYEALVPVDQLAEERASGNVFNGFQEASITFPPTYKYTPGTDSLENKKLQTPAWCDRVLYRSSKDCQVTPHSYQSVPEMRLSDHKPIRAVLEVSVRMVNEASVSLKSECVSEIRKPFPTKKLLEGTDGGCSVSLRPLHGGCRENECGGGEHG